MPPSLSLFPVRPKRGGLRRLPLSLVPLPRLPPAPPPAAAARTPSPPSPSSAASQPGSARRRPDPLPPSRRSAAATAFFPDLAGSAAFSPDPAGSAPLFPKSRAPGVRRDRVLPRIQRNPCRSFPSRWSATPPRSCPDPAGSVTAVSRYARARRRLVAVGEGVMHLLMDPSYSLPLLRCRIFFRDFYLKELETKILREGLLDNRPIDCVLCLMQQF